MHKSVNYECGGFGLRAEWLVMDWWMFHLLLYYILQQHVGNFKKFFCCQDANQVIDFKELFTGDLGADPFEFHLFGLNHTWVCLNTSFEFMCHCSFLSALHIWSISPILLFKTTPALSGCMEIMSFFKPTHKFLVGLRSGLWIWPLQDINIVVFKPSMCSFGFMLWVIVLLENKSSSKLQVSCRFHQVLLQDFPCVFVAFILPIKLSTLGADAEKHPHSMMLPSPCFTVGMVSFQFTFICMLPIRHI